MPFTNFKEKDEYYTQARRSTNTTYVCYDCEQVFQPIRHGQKFCTKCFKYARSTSKSIALKHSYLRNKRGQSSSSIGKSSVGVRLDQSKLVPECRPSFNSVVVVPTSSSLFHHREPDSNLAGECCKI
jgi:protein-arginine kinase activator protein McsA